MNDACDGMTIPIGVADLITHGTAVEAETQCQHGVFAGPGKRCREAATRAFYPRVGYASAFCDTHGQFAGTVPYSPPQHA